MPKYFILLYFNLPGLLTTNGEEKAYVLFFICNLHYCRIYFLGSDNITTPFSSLFHVRDAFCLAKNNSEEQVPQERKKI